MNSAEQAVADMKAILDGQRAFNMTPDNHPAETAAFDQSARLLEEIAENRERSMFALSGLAMIVVSFLEPEDIDAALGQFDTNLED